MTLSFKIPPGLRKALGQLAEKDMRTLSNYVTKVLIQHVESLKIEWREKKPKE